MNELRLKLAKGLLYTLTRISPMLNTKVAYRVKFGKFLDLNNPKTLNEKILWLKFNVYSNNPLVKQCADKYAVRSYIDKCGCSELLNELIDVYYKPEEIEWNKLPDKFAIKLNVGCGFNIICTDKEKINKEDTIRKLKFWMKDKQYLHYSEMQYKDVKPVILVEKFIGSDRGKLPEDYKFYCMNGEAKYVMICLDRDMGGHSKYYYYDKGWNLMPFSQDALDNPDISIEKPEGIDKAFEYADKLAKPFPFVRTDLYIVNGKVYFGELTFTPGGGLDFARLKKTDEVLGEMLILSDK